METRLSSLESKMTIIEHNLAQLTKRQATQTQILQQLINTSTTTQTQHVDDNKRGRKV